MADGGKTHLFTVTELMSSMLSTDRGEETTDQMNSFKVIYQATFTASISKEEFTEPERPKRHSTHSIDLIGSNRTQPSRLAEEAEAAQYGNAWTVPLGRGMNKKCCVQLPGPSRSGPFSHGGMSWQPH